MPTSDANCSDEMFSPIAHNMHGIFQRDIKTVFRATLFDGNRCPIVVHRFDWMQ